MAIIGTLAQLQAQIPGNARLAMGLEYLINFDAGKEFALLPPEKKRTHEICGKEVFAIIQEYQPKNWDKLAFEGHRSYIDIQCVFAGEELLLHTGTDRVTHWGEYDTERDIHFSEVSGYSSFLLRAGDACILYPTDMHAPCMKASSDATIRKVVIKVMI